MRPFIMTGTPHSIRLTTIRLPPLIRRRTSARRRRRQPLRHRRKASATRLPLRTIPPASITKSPAPTTAGTSSGFPKRPAPAFTSRMQAAFRGRTLRKRTRRIRSSIRTIAERSPSSSPTAMPKPEADRRRAGTTGLQGAERSSGIPQCGILAAIRSR